MQERNPLLGRKMSRRAMLSASLVGGLALTACGRSGSSSSAGPVAPINPPAIAAAEAARPHTGRTVAATLVPESRAIDLGGITVHTLTYSDTIPTPVIRANIGDDLAVAVTNRLDHATSVHWHGIALRNDMDGASPATPDIDPGKQFTYRFSVPHSGTYWAHPHTGLDTDFGLYVPIVVDDPKDSGNYDTEWIVVLDDWTDGVGKSPQQLYDDLRSRRGMGDMGGMGGMGGPGSGMGGMGGVGSSPLLGGDAGDISYPYYLVNGRISTAPSTFTATPGQRIRLRIINAGADTAFRVALAGHTMTVTHTDGFPVTPTETDAVLLGMGERYDVIVTAQDGVFPLVAVAEGKEASARALLSTGAGTAPDPAFQPTELNGRVATVETLTATDAVRMNIGTPDVRMTVNLTGGMMRYDWAINDGPYPNNTALSIKQGQRARLEFQNSSMMWHPMHLHGHTFQVLRSDGTLGPRKDTVIVQPMTALSVDLIADNPGDWMLHCHNGYHMEAGLMTRLDYRT
ncbi:MAG: multicopper oxidase family protein [Nocardiaceae bacterium]|nr:multicopper oxidase family protein [Nocardiaceae bacterium]